MACFIRQSLEAARTTSDDPIFHEKIVKHTMRMIAEMDLQVSPPVMAQQIHWHIRKETNVKDPYATVKKQMNQLAIRHYDELHEIVLSSKNPLLTAAKIAVSGNIIDSGVDFSPEEDNILKNLKLALEDRVVGDADVFVEELNKAKSVLYLCDNAGEFIWDQLLIEQIGVEKVTLVVRGRPILNDVCWDDIACLRDSNSLDDIDLEKEKFGFSGFSLNPKIKVMHNGSDAPSTILSDCSEELQNEFRTADIIISKGQGNYEALSETKAPIYLLFMAKCSVIASELGVSMNAHLIKRSPFFQEN